MDERDMKQEEKNRKEKKWGMLFFGILIFVFLIICNQESENP
jgi:uncharacterized integral membrane protein